MSKEKPSVPKGTRDFSPDQMIRRNYIFHTITTFFQRYGFLPIETPAMENLSSLMGKYGEEGDKLLFKILNSGDFLAQAGEEELFRRDSGKVSAQICERGLRYDLTVPFARFVVQHRNEIVFPFKRYQIQPVWRADKPQKGRYREFYQCDVDVVGSDSLLNEVELLQIADEVFSGLGISVTIKLNNRKILAGIAEVVGLTDKLTEITVAVDKVEKIGVEGVNKELEQKGIAPAAIAHLQNLFHITGSATEKLKTIREFLLTSDTGTKGVQETEEVLNLLNPLNLKANIDFDLTLARGLDYYTGAIIEVVSNDVKMGSICGGGRYDNLTGVFGMEGVSGVGISFGADRIYDVMEQLGLFPENVIGSTQLMFVNFGGQEREFCLQVLRKVRKEGISAEIYPDEAKLKKQMNYANARNIPFVVLVGEEELTQQKLSLKNMRTGEQSQLSVEELMTYLNPGKA